LKCAIRRAFKQSNEKFTPGRWFCSKKRSKRSHEEHVPRRSTVNPQMEKPSKRSHEGTEGDGFAAVRGWKTGKTKPRLQEWRSNPRLRKGKNDERSQYCQNGSRKQVLWQEKRAVEARAARMAIGLRENELSWLDERTVRSFGSPVPRKAWFYGCMIAVARSHLRRSMARGGRRGLLGALFRRWSCMDGRPSRSSALSLSPGHARADMDGSGGGSPQPLRISG
jgi:hypothetical protein